MTSENVSETSSATTLKSTDQLISIQKSKVTQGRFLVFGLLFLGTFATTLSKINFNATIVALCSKPENETMKAHFPIASHFIEQWTESQKDTLNGAYFIGYSLALIPSCRLSSKYGGKHVATFGGLLHITANMLTPAAVIGNGYLVLFSLRALVGAACATTVPAFFILLQQAVPEGEKSKGIAAMKVGSSIGAIALQFLLFGAISLLGKAKAWSTIFYLCAGLDLIWLLLWMVFVKEEPKLKVQRKPLKALAKLKRFLQTVIDMCFNLFSWCTSPPILAMVMAKLANVWLDSLLTAKLSEYITSVLDLDISQTTLYSALFNSICFVSILTTGTIGDCLTDRQVCRLTVLRKLFEVAASLGIAISMLLMATQVGIGNASSSLCTLFLVTFSTTVAFFGLVTAGSSTIIIDMTTEADSGLIAFVSTITTLFGFAVPHLVTCIIESDSGVINDETHSSKSWSSVFYATAFIYAASGIFFVLFASSEKKVWAKKVKNLMKNEEESVKPA